MVKLCLKIAIKSCWSGVATTGIFGEEYLRYLWQKVVGRETQQRAGGDLVSNLLPC
jgi:hypothetical protein